MASAFLAPEGVTTDSEPSAQAIAGLIRQIRREGIRALFLENISDPRLMQALARETGAALGPPLYSDALSRPDGPAPTYVRMIEYNTASAESGDAARTEGSSIQPADRVAARVARGRSSQVQSTWPKPASRSAAICSATPSGNRSQFKKRPSGRSRPQIAR